MFQYDQPAADLPIKKIIVLSFQFDCQVNPGTFPRTLEGP